MTIFKDVPNYEGFYIASSDEKIFNAKTNRELKQFNRCRKASKSVTLHKNGVQKTYHVSNLIGRTFIIDEEGIRFKHLDGNKNNNCVDNLIVFKKVAKNIPIKFIFDNSLIQFDSLREASEYLGKPDAFMTNYIHQISQSKLVIDNKFICVLQIN